MSNIRNNTKERAPFFSYLLSQTFHICLGFIILLKKFDLKYSWFYLVPTYENNSEEGTVGNPVTGVLAFIPKLPHPFQRDLHKAA